MPQPSKTSLPGRIDWVRGARLLLGFGLLVAFVLPLARRSINLSDEGYILQQALDMLNGKVLYRDMDAFVSPGIWFLVAGLFSVFEPSVLISRAIPVCVFLCTVAVSFRIVAVLASRGWAFVSMLLLCIFVVWAFPVWTFAFYSATAVMLSLWALERLLAWRRTGLDRDLFLTGLGFGLAIAFKQNYGVFALIGGMAGYGAIRFEQRTNTMEGRSGVAKELASVAAGGLSIGLPLVLYFFANGALADLFRSLVIQPFIFAGQHSVPYLPPTALFADDVLSNVDRLTYGAYSLYNAAIPTELLRSTRLIERLHVLLYQLPILAFAGAAFFCLRSRSVGETPQRSGFDAGLFSLLAVSGMLFLGVFPRADYNHLINLYQPVLILICVVAQRISIRSAQPRPAWLTGLVVTGSVLILAYAGVAGIWYRAHMVNMNTELAVPRGGVLVRPEQALRLTALIEIVWNNTGAGDALLGVPDLSMINFLSERDVPSPYYNLYQHHIAHDGGAGVVEGSRERDVRLVITGYSDFFSDRVRMRDYAPALIDYLDRFFAIKLTAGGDNFVFLKRRPRPLPRQEEIRILEDCELDPAPEDADHRIQGHLLFTTLYQDQGSQHEKPNVLVESRCRVEVPPEGGELRVRIDTRPPLSAARGANLTVEVIAIDEAGEAQLLSKRFPVFHPFGLELVREWPAEDRIDLSRWAGREITLLFRSHRRGWVQSDPFSYKGYATMWLGPRIVVPAKR